VKSRHISGTTLNVAQRKASSEALLAVTGARDGGSPTLRAFARSGACCHVNTLRTISHFPIPPVGILHPAPYAEVTRPALTPIPPTSTRAWSTTAQLSINLGGHHRTAPWHALPPPPLEAVPRCRARKTTTATKAVAFPRPPQKSTGGAWRTPHGRCPQGPSAITTATSEPSRDISQPPLFPVWGGSWPPFKPRDVMCDASGRFVECPVPRMLNIA